MPHAAQSCDWHYVLAPGVTLKSQLGQLVDTVSRNSDWIECTFFVAAKLPSRAAHLRFAPTCARTPLAKARGETSFLPRFSEGGGPSPLAMVEGGG